MDAPLDTSALRPACWPRQTHPTGQMGQTTPLRPVIGAERRLTGGGARRLCARARGVIAGKGCPQTMSLPAPLKVLHVAPSFWPATAWGGPVFSTKALCDGLAARGDVTLQVLCTDSTGPGRRDRLRLSANPDRFPAGYDVRYAAKRLGRDVAPGLLAPMIRLMRWADLVHLTGTYSFPTLPTLVAVRALGRPLVWSPRGALQATNEWAAATSRKKRLFEALCRRLLPRHTTLHLTTQEEARLTAQTLPDVAGAVIPNSVAVPPALLARSPRRDGPVRLIFLSRLHEKKGLDLVIHALPALPFAATLDIYGEGTPGYVAQLTALVTKLGIRDQVRFHGHVEGAAKEAAFAQADLFVLPSHSENFGNVIAEALARAVPVLISTACPWPEVGPRGCGWQIPPTSEAVTEALIALSDANLPDMGARGREWMKDSFSPTSVAEQMAHLYDQTMRVTS